MRAVVAGLARAAVTALVKSDPSPLGIAAAGSAIDQVIAWLPAFFRKES